MNEPLVIDHDPAPGKSFAEVSVVVVLSDVPPRAVSHGWGDMSWLKQ